RGSQRAGREKDSELSWTEPEERHSEHAGRVRRQVGFRGDEKIGAEQHCRVERIDETRASQSGQQERRTREIDYMVDVIAIAWTLLPTNSRDRAVEAVAKPVRGEADNDRRRCP